MKKILIRIKGKIKRALIRLGVFKDKSPKDYYVSKISRKAPWAYVAYIPDVFYFRNNPSNLNKHQNRREAIAQVDILNDLGYNVYVQNYLTNSEIPNIKFDIVFGHEPNFTRVAIMNPKALKIHYVPGAFRGHRNKQIIDMTDYFNKTYNAKVPYRRLLEYENMNYSSEVAYDIADKILLIGSKYTVATFPENIQPKITTIHQSTQPIRTNQYIQESSSKDFFFMGSGGNLLKGLSLLVEYFSKHQELTIHFVGPIEQDVKEALEPIITDNMKFYGFVDVNSDLMQEIMCRCNFVLYPSGSEGMPGAVLNAMKNGLIPIVTRWSAFDEIDDYGYVIDKWNVESIDKGVEWGLSLTEEEMLSRKNRCSAYVNSTYNIERYKQEFKDFLEDSINKFKKGDIRHE